VRKLSLAMGEPVDLQKWRRLSARFRKRRQRRRSPGTGDAKGPVAENRETALPTGHPATIGTQNGTATRRTFPQQFVVLPRMAIACTFIVCAPAVGAKTRCADTAQE